MTLGDLGATNWRVRSWVAAAVMAMGTITGCRGDEIDASSAMVRTSPASLSVEGAWGLFDRSIESGFVPDETVIRAALDRQEQLSAIKVYGASPYRLRVGGLSRR